jgi:drug/metabolite transporter (DMT)-like permease
MTGLGVTLGLGAASLQSLSYLLSRRYVQKPGRSVPHLLVHAHVWMALVSVPMLLLLWTREMPPLRQYVWPLAADAVAYLVGQAGLFYALRQTEASRVAPLLGLKIVLLAVLTSTILGESLGAQHWVAVFLAVAAAWTLNWTGGSLSLPALAGVMIACTGYTLSDFSIRLLIDALAPVPRLYAATIGVFLSYIVCGILVIPFLPRWGSTKLQDWTESIAYAAVATIGVVLGNIVQSTRALISIGLGILIASQGHLHLERHVPPAVIIRRTAAAAMMCLAIGLFVAA